MSSQYKRMKRFILTNNNSFLANKCVFFAKLFLFTGQPDLILFDWGKILGLNFICKNFNQNGLLNGIFDVFL